jgi:hypothetical protein
MKLQTALVVAILSSPLGAQTAQDQSVGLIQKAAVRALNFEQGDSGSLNKSRSDFTPQGWNEFMKHMQGFVDGKSAPTFSSKFVPAGNPAIVSKENGTIRLKIPGTLTQTQGKSSTRYRLRIEVQASGTPPKMEHLEQITCAGTSAATYCM